MANYYRWGLNDDPPLFLQLINPAGTGATGLAPDIAIRRHRLLDGTLLDGNYWNGVGGFTATPTFNAMSEFDSADNPGLYLYQFEQSLIASETIYLVYFRHAAAPVGFAVEQHIVSNELFVPSSNPAVPILPGDTVMGRLADMENSTGDVALANADAVWDELLAGHAIPGSTGEALSKCAAAFVGARQIDILVEDTGSTPIQGAQIDVYDFTNTIFTGARIFSDVNGQVSLAIDDGGFNLRVFASGFSFTVPIPLTVTADVLEPTPFVITGTPGFVIPTPSAPDLCVIFGTLRDAAGRAIPGACIEVFATAPQVVSGIQKGQALVVATTDSAGAFQFELVRTTIVNVKVESADIDEDRTVPDAASQDFTTWT